MTKAHDRRSRVAEPVQVYLDTQDRGALEQLARHLDLSKSDVIRRALNALERATFANEGHPALRVVGLASAETAPPLSYDPAVEHDRYLAEHAESRPGRKKKRGG